MKDENFSRTLITLQEGVIDFQSLGVIDEAYADSRDSIYRMNKLLEAAIKGINALWAEIRKRDNIIANYRQQIERDKLIHRAAPGGGGLGAGCHTGTKGTDSSAPADAFAQNDERGTRDGRPLIRPFGAPSPEGEGFAENGGEDG